MLWIPEPIASSLLCSPSLLEFFALFFVGTKNKINNSVVEVAGRDLKTKRSFSDDK